MSLIGYFDESGTDKANRFLVVSGFFSDDDQWNRFSNEWNALLTKFDVSYFKSKEFDDGRRGYGPYKEWSEEKRAEYMNLLVGVIKRRTFKSFSTSLHKDAYDGIIAPDPQLRKNFYSAFVFCAVNCAHAVCEWRDELHAGESLVFTFDKGHKNQQQLLDVGKRVMVGNHRRIEDVRTGDDRELPALQAADLLAFEICAEKRNATVQTTKWSRHPLLILHEHPHDWVTVGADNLLTEINRLLPTRHP